MRPATNAKRLTPQSFAASVALIPAFGNSGREHDRTRKPLGDLGYIFYPVPAPVFDIRPPLSGELASLSSDVSVNVLGVQISAISFPPSDVQYRPTAPLRGACQVTQRCGGLRTWVFTRVPFTCQGSAVAAWSASRAASQHFPATRVSRDGTGYPIRENHRRCG
jgi:hypothetical protein